MALIGENDGVIVDYSVAAIPGGADVSWEHLDVAADAGHKLLLAVNGDLEAILPQGSDYYSVMLRSGNHRVEVRPHRGEARSVPDMHGYDYGRRAFMRWTPSESADCVAYLIYSNNGTGAIDYVDPLDIITRVDVVRRWFQAGTGTGAGRVGID